MKGIHYYTEKDTGDLLFIDGSSGRIDHKGIYAFDGCANAISNLPSSINWTGISQEYLHEKCSRVSERQVMLTALTNKDICTLLFRAEWVRQSRRVEREPSLPYPEETDDLCSPAETAVHRKLSRLAAQTVA